MNRRARFALAALVGVVVGGCGSRPCGKESRTAADPRAASAHAAGQRTKGGATVAVPAGYARMVVAGVAPTKQGNAVVLSDEGHAVGIPIFVGDTEALAIALRVRGQSYTRPLTHDLLDAVMRRLGGRLSSVRVDALKDEVFHATIVIVRPDGQLTEIDSRASDAIALAVGNGAPIFVAREVIEQAGIDLGSLGLSPAGDDDHSEPGPMHEGGPPPVKM